MTQPFFEHHLFQLLKRFDQQTAPFDRFLSCYFRAHRALGSKDRQRILEVSYQMMRWRGLLDYLIEGLPSWQRRYQLLQRHPENHPRYSKAPLHLQVSCPEELFSRLKKDYGEKGAVELAQLYNTEAPLTIRVNPLKTTREALFERLSLRFEMRYCSHSPLGLQFTKREPLIALAEFKEGLFEIQDEASQIAASHVKLRPGQHVLDYCAGAGGKSLAFAATLEGQGQIYLHDIRPAILEQAKKRFKRAGIQNYQILPPNHPTLRKLHQKMDWVIVDAPCSGTGTLRRNPDQKWKFSQEQLTRLIEQQRTIFEEALNYLAPKGKIIYMTCSILKIENEEQITYFLKQHHLKLEAPAFFSLPRLGAMDGFFAAVCTF